jgi:hypothetical protein
MLSAVSSICTSLSFCAARVAHPSVPFLLQLLYGANPGMSDAEFDAAAAAHGHDGKLARENNKGWRTYSCRDVEGDFSAQVRVRIQQAFPVNINGMGGGATVYEVVEEHHRRSEACGGCGSGLGGASVAEASAQGWTLEVSVCVC